MVDIEKGAGSGISRFFGRSSPQPGKQRTKRFDLGFRQPVIFYKGRQHGGDGPSIETVEKRTAFLSDVVVFLHKRGIDEDPSILFVGEHPLRYQTFDQRLDGFRTP